MKKFILLSLCIATSAFGAGIQQQIDLLTAQHSMALAIRAMRTTNDSNQDATYSKRLAALQKKLSTSVPSPTPSSSH